MICEYVNRFPSCENSLQNSSAVPDLYHSISGWGVAWSATSLRIKQYDTYLPFQIQFLEPIPLLSLPTAVELRQVHEGDGLSLHKEDGICGHPECRCVIPDAVESGNVLRKGHQRRIWNIVLSKGDHRSVAQLEGSGPGSAVVPHCCITWQDGATVLLGVDDINGHRCITLTCSGGGKGGGIDRDAVQYLRQGRLSAIQALVEKGIAWGSSRVVQDGRRRRG